MSTRVSRNWACEAVSLESVRQDRLILFSSGQPESHPMSFEQISYLAQIVASVGVILSRVFVGLQIRQNTANLQRSEHNSTMEQWTAIRMAITKNRDAAELMTAGLSGERRVDAVDQLRLEMMLNEIAWASFHIWERTKRGIFQKGPSSFRVGRSCAACGRPTMAGPVADGKSDALSSSLCRGCRCVTYQDLARDKIRAPQSASAPSGRSPYP